MHKKQLMDYAQSRSCFMSDNMYTLEGVCTQIVINMYTLESVCTQIVIRLWDLTGKGGWGVAGGGGGRREK